MAAERGEYQGKPVLTLTNEQGFRGLSFGATKAILILEHLNDIIEFVRESGNGRGQEVLTQLEQEWKNNHE